MNISNRLKEIEQLKDGVEFDIDGCLSFIIYEFDIRIYNENDKRIMEINTYPINPREIFKYIDYIR